MAQTKLKAFEEALKADEALRQSYEEALKGVTEAANDGEVIQKAAAQLGYEIPLEELEQAWASAQELDEAELDAVAGGGVLRDDWCVLDYSCFSTLWHDRPGTNNACMFDYQCFHIYHHS